MQLYIVRHGDAIDHSHPSVTSDAMRPLTELGRAEVTVAARLLGQLGVKPDLVLSSPLVRAMQTAEIIADARMAEPAVHVSDNLAPGGSLEQVVPDVLRHGPVRQVLLAGHNPGVGQLAGYLCWGELDIVVPFRTATVCRVDLPDGHDGPGTGDLRWLLPPRLARRLLGN